MTYGDFMTFKDRDAKAGLAWSVGWSQSLQNLLQSLSAVQN